MICRSRSPRTLSPQSRVSFQARRSRAEGPAGFKVGLFATGLQMPRVIRIAPNGDIFVVETQAGQVHVFRGIGRWKAEKKIGFRHGLA